MSLITDDWLEAQYRQHLRLSLDSIMLLRYVGIRFPLNFGASTGS